MKLESDRIKEIQRVKRCENLKERINKYQELKQKEQGVKMK